ncbi:MAG: hypothetical protein WC848_06110, partial [Parcubacteria group bacterium]
KDSTNGSFTCTYDKNGTYAPSLKVTGPSCLATPVAKINVNNTAKDCRPDAPDCASYTCKDVSCNDGCNLQVGEKDCVGRR